MNSGKVTRNSDSIPVNTQNISVQKVYGLTAQETPKPAIQETYGLSMREAYGEELVKLGEEYPGLVVLDADVSSSTRSFLFGKKYPERFFNVGVAEANMADIAAGLALSGCIPVVNSFAVFLTLKATEQIRNVICYNRLPVVLVGSYAGLSDSYDGASHQSVEDLALMRAIPGLRVVVPADTEELRQALRQILKSPAPTYLRICRNRMPALPVPFQPLRLGKISKLKNGSDITLAACGITVPMACRAASVLSSSGISAEVLNISTLKPLDKETLLQSVRKTKRILVIEEHSIIGGLGSAVAETISREFPVFTDYIGITDTFTETGGYEELLNKYRISSQAIEAKAKELINKTI
ncbi:transketolase family protein [Parabacteroides pacaensis]|uniref:transketolase family protein n=1 Tax=Parabacteroides pacaensis TaxID=2086575 RepID=UPI0018FEB6CB|nr:transketolase C-terminal domain-containing protein [Parabacteroides pacaensis]